MTLHTSVFLPPSELCTGLNKACLDNSGTGREYGTPTVERWLKSTDTAYELTHTKAPDATKCTSVICTGVCRTTFSVSIYSTEVLSSSEHASLLQRSEILEESEQGRSSCYTLKSVEKIMKKVNTSATHIAVNLC